MFFKQLPRTIIGRMKTYIGLNLILPKISLNVISADTHAASCMINQITIN